MSSFKHSSPLVFFFLLGISLSLCQDLTMSFVGSSNIPTFYWEIESRPALDGWVELEVENRTVYEWNGTEIFGESRTDDPPGIMNWTFSIDDPSLADIDYSWVLICDTKQGAVGGHSGNDFWWRFESVLGVSDLDQLTGSGSDTSPSLNQPFQGYWYKAYKQNGFSWQTDYHDHEANSVRVGLPMGSNTISIAGRSRGFQMDRCALFFYNNTDGLANTANGLRPLGDRKIPQGGSSTFAEVGNNFFVPPPESDGESDGNDGNGTGDSRSSSLNSIIVGLQSLML